MLNDDDVRSATDRLLNDESLIAALKDDEAKALIDWAVGELQTDDSAGSVESREALLRQAMGEINDLVGNRQALVADDLEERMARLLVGDLDPRSQVRLGIERDIAQVTAEKDHIAGVDLVKRLTEVTTKAWRLKQQGVVIAPAALVTPDSRTNPSTVASVPANNAPRSRPIPRPTPIPPGKQGLLARLFGRK